MNIAQPIRDMEKIDQVMDYYRTKKLNERNVLFMVMGFNTALRVSDLLSLQWKDVYDQERNVCMEHIITTEKKTHKNTQIKMNWKIKKALLDYRKYLSQKKEIDPESFLFEGRDNMPITRVQAYRILKEAANACNLEGTISPHSMRKTFGYHAWKAGVEPVLLMNIFNHSSFSITIRYLGIEQDDRDTVFDKICI